MNELIEIAIFFLLISIAYKFSLEYIASKYINKHNKDKFGFLSEKEFSKLQGLVLNDLSTKQQSQIIKMLKSHLIYNIQELKNEENNIDLKFNKYIENESAMWLEDIKNQSLIEYNSHKK